MKYEGYVKATKLLDTYLKGAVSLTAGKTKEEAKKLLEEYHNANKKVVTEDRYGRDAVDDKVVALKEKVASYDLKTKVNYATDADVTKSVAEGMSKMAVALMKDPTPYSTAIFAAVAGYTPKKLAAEFSKSETKEEAKKAADYADIKHAQLALKLLKKEMKAADFAKNYATYGLPTGMLPVLKNQKGGR
ncbi:MAG: hypothetical protein IJ752_08100 [Alphaproteobacteria bacterium]|nr:hypothetical protein [Alphaproteobacteria bacterium]